MAKATTRYVCSSCGTTSPKWAGKCDGCGEWNTMSEEASPALSAPGKKAIGRRVKLESLQVPDDQPPLTRHRSDIAELDRVIGGGVVPGSAMLIGGDPGIGKSTLLLQLLCKFAQKGLKTAYFSGEESAEQVRMRAQRLQLSSSPLQLATATNALLCFETFLNTLLSID